MAVKPIIDATDFRDDVAISDLDLDASFRNQAALFASYASKFFEAEQQSGNKEIMFDLVRAKLDKEVRDRLDAEKGESGLAKKYTENVVKYEIERNPAYISAYKDLNEANAIVNLVKNALEAFKQRKDMLVSLGANARQEMSGELVMRRRDSASSDRDAILAETGRRMGVAA